MGTVRLNGDYKYFVDQLTKAKETFKVQTTTKSQIIKTNGVNYMFASEHFKLSDLGLFNKLKKEVRDQIKKNKLTPPPIERSFYFRTETFEPIGLGEFVELHDVLEFDVNRAYYKALLNLGYITPAFFEKCQQIEKKLRLALVGSLATSKLILDYQGGELADYEVKEDPILRRVFFHVVKYVDECLYTFSKMAGDKFLFYWVDGIYLRNYPEAEKHRDRIAKYYDLEFSTERLPKVVIANVSETQTIIAAQKPSGKVKPFYLPTIFRT